MTSREISKKAGHKERVLDPDQIIYLAHAANPAHWMAPMSTDYPRLVHEFLRMMRDRQIPFVIVGGIALLHYIRGRNTGGIDILMSAQRLDALRELSVTEQNQMFGMADFRGLRIDLLFLEHPFFELVSSKFSTSQPYPVGPLPTATIEGLILLKLFALPSLYRQFDLDRVAIYEADITQLLARTEQDDPFFLKILSDYLPETDRRELEAVLRDCRKKVARFKNGGQAE
jgi:hypothetical protein